MKKAALLSFGLISLLAVVVCLFLFWEPIGTAFFSFIDKENIKEFLERTGPVAPLVFIGLQALQVLMAPIPMQVFGLAGGYIFGAFWGTVYSIIGLTIGSFLAIWLTRLFGRKLVERFVKKETLEKFDHLAEKSGLLVFFLVFLLPALPDDAICFIAGLTKLPILALVLVAFLGRLPGLLALTLTGEHLGDSGLFFYLITALVLFVGMIIIFRPQIEALFRKRAQQGFPEEGKGEGGSGKPSVS
jgi:uncharacterized membrane protein YdjX (TVP38/TMEM64 family)